MLWVEFWVDKFGLIQRRLADLQSPGDDPVHQFHNSLLTRNRALILLHQLSLFPLEFVVGTLDRSVEAFMLIDFFLQERDGVHS